MSVTISRTPVLLIGATTNRPWLWAIRGKCPVPDIFSTACAWSVFLLRFWKHSAVRRGDLSTRSTARRRLVCGFGHDGAAGSHRVGSDAYHDT
jgi:hypothetical protein